MRGRPSRSWRPLAACLARMHEAGVAHGALSADARAVPRDGAPVLIGFGARAAVRAGAARGGARADAGGGRRPRRAGGPGGRGARPGDRAARGGGRGVRRVAAGVSRCTDLEARLGAGAVRAGGRAPGACSTRPDGGRPDGAGDRASGRCPSPREPAAAPSGAGRPAARVRARSRSRGRRCARGGRRGRRPTAARARGGRGLPRSWWSRWRWCRRRAADRDAPMPAIRRRSTGDDRRQRCRPRSPATIRSPPCAAAATAATDCFRDLSVLCLDDVDERGPRPRRRPRRARRGASTRGRSRRVSRATVPRSSSGSATRRSIALGAGQRSGLGPSDEGRGRMADPRLPRGSAQVVRCRGSWRSRRSRGGP